jgi:hypothetical protein
MKVGLHGNRCERRASRAHEIKTLILRDFFRRLWNSDTRQVGTACRDPAGFAGRFTLG